MIEGTDVADAFTCFVGGSYRATYTFRSGCGGVGIRAQPLVTVVRYG